MQKRNSARGIHRYNLVCSSRWTSRPSISTARQDATRLQWHGYQQLRAGNGQAPGHFRKNGLDLEVVYVNSGSLLSQALIAGTFDLSMSQGSEAMIAKLRGADVRIVAVIANRFNHVYLAAPSITSFKQLKGKKVAVSRFGSGSHFQTNLALKEGGLDRKRMSRYCKSATPPRGSRRS